MSTDTVDDAQATERAGQIAGLRALAAFLDDHPDVPVPDRLWHYDWETESVAEVVRIAEQLDAHVKHDSNVILAAHFGALTVEWRYSARPLLERRTVRREELVLPEALEARIAPEPEIRP